MKTLLRLWSSYDHHNLLFLSNLLHCLNEMVSCSTSYQNDLCKMLTILRLQEVYQFLNEQTKHYPIYCFLSNLNKLAVGVWHCRINAEALACCVFNQINSIRYELVSVKHLLNRCILPITSTLVAPKLTVEPRDVQEYGYSESRGSPTSNLWYNSLLS